MFNDNLTLTTIMIILTYYQKIRFKIRFTKENNFWY